MSDNLFCFKPWRVGWDLLFGTIVIVSLGAILISALHGKGLIAGLAIAILLQAIVAFSVTLIHELGHGVAALACGYNVHKINVQGLTLLPRGKNWPRFFFSKNDTFAGDVVSSPKLPRGALWKDATISAAGSVANIAAALLLFALALVRRDVEAANAIMQTIDTADRTTNHRFPYFSAVIEQVSGDHDAAVRWLAAMRSVADKYGARFDDEDLHLIKLIESNDTLKGLVPNAVE